MGLPRMRTQVIFFTYNRECGIDYPTEMNQFLDAHGTIINQIKEVVTEKFITFIIYYDIDTTKDDPVYNELYMYGKKEK